MREREKEDEKEGVEWYIMKNQERCGWIVYTGAWHKRSSSSRRRRRDMSEKYR